MSTSRLPLGDRTGTVPALIWDDVAQARDVCRPGEVVFVIGRYAMHPRFGPQLAVSSVRAPHWTANSSPTT